MKTFMARDQYGQTYHDLGPHPRKELMRRLGKAHVDRMYIDTKAGQAMHIGWIIGGLWLTVYEVKPMEVQL